MTYSKGYTPGPFPSPIKDRPSVMWSETEERKAKKESQRISAQQAAQKVTQFKRHQCANFTGPT